MEKRGKGFRKKMIGENYIVNSILSKVASILAVSNKIGIKAEVTLNVWNSKSFDVMPIIASYGCIGYIKKMYSFLSSSKC